MDMKEFKEFKIIKDNENKNAVLYKIDNEHQFYIEPNFYTQLIYVKDHFESDYLKIVDKIIEIVKRNGKVIFTADFEHPVVYKDSYIYRELSDVLAELKLSIDNKSNPDSDWKD